ncbi:MAG TPA: SCP2 sterol-binding domain-containing protein [Acidimicrobiales bacterium]|nr:SCP2 sterol-binding domain-containing protein [Acidimicrobiales bacterium]
MADEFNVSDRDELAKLVEGRSDEEINAAVGDGADGVLDQIFEAMKQSFQPARAAGQSAVVQWDIAAADGTRTYQFKVDGGSCEVLKGGTEAARVTLGLSLPDFLRFIGGVLEPMQAFMTGKLKLSGDMMFAQSMQAWFET